MQRTRYIDNGGDTVFSRHNSPVRELSADFEDETTDERENRRPARIGTLRDEYVSCREPAGLTEVPDKTGHAAHAASAGRQALQECTGWLRVRQRDATWSTR